MICDTRVQRPRSGVKLSGVHGTTFALQFYEAMVRSGLSQTDFNGHCKGGVIAATLQREDPRRQTVLSFPNRDEARTRLSRAFLGLLNEHRKHNTLLSKLPTKPWDEYLEKMGLTIVLPIDLEMEDIYSALGRSKGQSTSLKRVWDAIESGSIFLRPALEPSPCPVVSN